MAAIQASVDGAPAGNVAGERHYKMLIGGAWVDAKSGATLQSINPATEEPIATFPHAQTEDVDAAVEAAKEGFQEWRGYTWARRAKVMRELADRMAQKVEHFALLDTMDQGSPLTAMRRDSQRAMSEFYYYASIASEIKGTTFEAPNNVVAASYRQPFGVVGRIIPFNHPYRFCAKIAPIIAAGNAVILKPAESTSLSAFDFGALTLDLFPAGVINVVSGLG